MSAITHSETNQFPTRHTNHAITGSKVNQWAIPLGRLFYSLIFIVSGITHFSSGTVAYADNAGVPFADILVPVSGIFALLGGVSVLLGAHARFGALLLILFLAPVTFLMHDFWTFNDPAMAEMQLIHFLKNISILGGACFIAFYGAGPMSWDHHQQVNQQRS
ncbi:MAG TPA: DoxX family protein [Bacteriovoracaceae bacterium]|nr:DoxX family protein [Bacteriovoracaceae bacterium]